MARFETEMRRTKSRGLQLLAGIALLLLAGIILAAYWRPVPALEAAPVSVPTVVPGAPLSARLPWPSQGSAAIGVVGLGSVGAANDSAARPLASVTKVMTALVILDDHPLALGEQGPQLTITFSDVRDYLLLAGDDQSVVPVREGDLLKQRQLLEGLLIPSGNNYASLLARWDSGSIEAFVAKMNAKAASLGMTHTHYADASGISPQSSGTARGAGRKHEGRRVGGQPDGQRF